MARSKVISGIKNHHSSEVYCLTDSCGVLKKVSPSFESVFGYSSHEIIEKNISTIIPFQELQKIKDWVASDKDALYESETKIKKQKGPCLYVSLICEKQNDEIHWYIKDITQQKNIEKKHHHIKVRYEQLLSAIKDGVILLDKDTGLIIEANQAICDLLCCTQKALLDKHIWNIPAFRSMVSDENVFDEKMHQITIKESEFVLHNQTNQQAHVVEIVGNCYTIDNQNMIQLNVHDISRNRKILKDLAHSHDLMRYIIEHDRSAVAVHDNQLRYLYVSQDYLKSYNVKEKDVIGKHHYEVFPDIPQKWRDIHQKTLKGEIFSAEDDPFVREDGSVDWTRWECRPWYQSDGSIGGIIIYTEVINKQKQKELELSQTKAYLEALIEYTNAMIWVWNESFRIMKCNQAFQKVTGLDFEEIKEEKIGTVFPNVQQLIKQITEKLLISHHIDVQEIQITNTDGKILTLLCSFSMIQDPNDGEQKLFIGQGQDITQRMVAEKELRYLSEHDSLTGLYSRRHFEQAVQKANHERCFPLSLVMVDINGLKLINDSFGHEKGDEFLIKTGELLKNACRPLDIAARLGGDEFAILLPKTPFKEAFEWINSIKAKALEQQIMKVQLSISYGIDTKENIKKSTYELFANAENDLFRHKGYERNSMRSKTVDIIMHTLFEKSNREMLHSKRVSELCESLAKGMKRDYDFIHRIKTAALLHDIGKIGIDEKILNKKGLLDCEEWEKMKNHCDVGYRILGAAKEFSDLADVILAHHERWDGNGYPNKLKENQIPLEARMIAVVDAYDAMTSTRTYQKPISKEAAICELQQCAGTQFDPNVVKVFIEKVLHQDSCL